MTGLTNAPEQVDDVDTHAATHCAGGSDPLTPADIGAVNKAGDTMSGLLTAAIGVHLSGGRVTHADSNQGFYICNYTSDGREATLELNAYHDKITFNHTNKEGTAIVYENILHTGNKPSGSFVGTGVARSVSVGGLGAVLYIQGYDFNGFVCPNCAFLSDPAVQFAVYTQVRYSGGVLYLDGSICNTELYEYYYQVL